MKITLLLVACAIICAAGYPNLPQTFTAKVNLRAVSHRGYGNDTGSGIWAIDEKAQSAVENYVYDKGTFDSFSLDRYDLGKLYRVYSTNKSRCDTFPVNESMPNEWAWVEQSQSAGQQQFQGKSVDIWQLNIGYGTRRIAVWSTNTSIPAWLDFRGGERDTYIEFETFSTVAAASSVFAVPSVCQTSSGRRPSNNVGCIASATVMANAEIWVKNDVPYNTDGTYMDYREDCSGYVSFCWKSGPPGHDTMTFHEVAHPITKAELLPGDCMLYASEHVCLFGGWIDAAHTHYWAYEETQPCSDNPNWCNTRKDDVVYPYYYDPNDFLPYRYNGFC